MRAFKVIALSCSGKGKKIYSSGDVVDESGFPDGVADELIAKGFIVEITESDENKKEATAKKETAKKPKGKK
jgi:hypothetical protein